MNVLIICHVFPPEHAPAGVNAMELAEDLAAAGHDVSVMTGWPSHPDGPLYPGWRAKFRHVERTARGYRLIRCRHSFHARHSMFWKMWYYLTFAVTTFLAVLFESRYDVICGDTTPVFGPISCLLAARLKRSRFVYKIDDVHPEAARNAGMLTEGLTYRMLRGLDAWICRRSDAVLCLTPAMRQLVLDRPVPAGKVHVASQWLDGSKIVPSDRLNAWRGEQAIPNDCFVVLNAGTIGYISGATIVVEAAKRLQSRKDILFLLVGGGPLKEPCEQLARDYGLTNVRFLPFQPAQSLCQMQACGDVGLVTLLPQCGESSIPSKMHGYTAAGRPVIASVDADAPTALLLQQYQCGLIVPPQDADALAGAIAQLADDREQARRLGGRARQLFMDVFDRKAATKFIETMLAGQ